MTTTNPPPDVSPLTTADQLLTGGHTDRTLCKVANPGAPVPYRSADMCQNAATHRVEVGHTEDDEYIGTVYTRVCDGHVEMARQLPGFRSVSPLLPAAPEAGAQ